MPEPIVRIFRTSLPSSQLAAVESALVEHFTRFATSWRVFSHFIGVARHDAETELVVVSGWPSEAELAKANASLGGQAARQGALGELIARGHAEDLELVDQLASSFAPGVGSVLRIGRVPLRPGADEAALVRIGETQRGLIESAGLAVVQTLRRPSHGGTDLTAIGVWRDEEALQRGLDGLPPLDQRLPDRLLRAPITIATYELLPVTALGLSPVGPALVVIDDAGSIVDVTPAAATLLGRDIWDLLGLRLAELSPDGDGPVRAFHLPGRGDVLLHAVVARDMPAPGRHVTLIAPAGQPAPSDADLAGAVTKAYRWQPVG